MTVPTVNDSVQLYEYGYTLSNRGETHNSVLGIIGESDLARYTAYAEDANYREAHQPNIAGIVPKNHPTFSTKYWVRPVSSQRAHA